MKLKDPKIKHAKATDSPLKLSDGHGLFLLVNLNNRKYWRFAYRFSGKQKTLALGVYPDVTLLKARELRDDARKMLASGVDPGENRKAIKISKIGQNANSFEVVAREWFTNNAPTWAPLIVIRSFVVLSVIFSLG